MAAFLGGLLAGGAVGLFLAALLTANPLSELRDENHDLRQRLAECTCREGA